MSVYQTDGYERLELDTFTQAPQEKDLKDGPVKLLFSPPLFKDDLNNLGIDVMDVSKPLRVVSLKIIGHETEDPDLYLKLSSNEDQPQNFVELTLEAAPTNVNPTVEFIVCYSYGNYTNL